MPKRSTRRKPPRVQTRRPRRAATSADLEYWNLTHQPLQCLVFLFPMVIAYEAGMIFLHGRTAYGERPGLAAQQLLEWFFSLFGATGFYLPGAALIIVLVAWHFASKKAWKISVPTLVGMAGESIVLALPLLLLNRWIPVLKSHALQARVTASSGDNRLEDLLLSVGAGLYEELVFRLIVITLVTMLLIDVGRMNQIVGVALSVVVSSLAFAAHHYYPIGADPWSTSEFAFRAAAGAYLAAVFVLRGFGLAVGCHVTYDVMAFLS